MTVVICIEKQEDKNIFPVSAAPAPADAKQAEIEDNQGLAEDEKDIAQGCHPPKTCHR